jgi:anti-sigma factor RsiW
MTDAPNHRCDRFVERVTAYLEGALDAPTQRQIEEGLAECEGCQRYLDQIRQTVGILNDLPTRPLSDDTRNALLDTFRRAAP